MGTATVRFDCLADSFFACLPCLTVQKKACGDEISDEIKENISDLGLAILRAVAKRSVFFGGVYFYSQSKRVSYSRKLRVYTQKYRLWKSKEIIIRNN